MDTHKSLATGGIIWQFLHGKRGIENLTGPLGSGGAGVNGTVKGTPLCSACAHSPILSNSRQPAPPRTTTPTAITLNTHTNNHYSLSELCLLQKKGRKGAAPPRPPGERGMWVDPEGPTHPPTPAPTLQGGGRGSLSVFGKKAWSKKQKEITDQNMV